MKKKGITGAQVELIQMTVKNGKLAENLTRHSFSNKTFGFFLVLFEMCCMYYIVLIMCQSSQNSNVEVLFAHAKLE